MVTKRMNTTVIRLSDGVLVSWLHVTMQLSLVAPTFWGKSLELFLLILLQMEFRQIIWKEKNTIGTNTMYNGDSRSLRIWECIDKKGKKDWHHGNLIRWKIPTNSFIKGKKMQDRTHNARKARFYRHRAFTWFSTWSSIYNILAVVRLASWI